jgi:hypothetical protein
VAPALDARRARKGTSRGPGPGDVRRARLARKGELRLGLVDRRRGALLAHAVCRGQAACLVAVVPAPETVLAAQRRPDFLVWPVGHGADVARRARRPPRRMEHVVDLERTGRGLAVDGRLELRVEPRRRFVLLPVDKRVVDVLLPELVLGRLGWGW